MRLKPVAQNREEEEKGRLGRGGGDKAPLKPSLKRTHGSFSQVVEFSLSVLYLSARGRGRDELTGFPPHLSTMSAN